MYIRRVKRKTTYKLSQASQPAPLKEAPSAAVVVPEAPAAGPMVRTQIYLTPEEHDYVQKEGARRGEPMAAVIRSLIDEKMTIPDEAWENNPLLAPPADASFIGPEDGAINHDHYIYGGPKKWMKRGGKWVEAPPLPDNYFSDRAASDAYDRMLEEGP
jgi:hypothetical protein